MIRYYVHLEGSLFEDLIQSYGYYAVFIFACIEGEVAVLTAGFLCKSGLLSLKLVILFAFLGTFMTEQIMFFIGRIYGSKLLEKHPDLSKKSRRIIEFLRRYKRGFIFGSRFVYGIRNISPMIMGTAGINPLLFSSLNIPAALIWSVIVAGAGYLFADALDSAEWEIKVLQILGLVIVIVGLLVFINKKTRTKSSSMR